MHSQFRFFEHVPEMDATQFQVVSAMIKVLPGSGRVTREWSHAMNARIEEARASIVSEGVDYETWFETAFEGSDYLIAIMSKAPNPPSPDGKHAIDAVHAEFKRKAWDRTVRIPSQLVASADFAPSDHGPVAAMHLIRCARMHADFVASCIRTNLSDSDRRLRIAEHVFRHPLGEEVVFAWFARGTAPEIEEVALRQQQSQDQCRSLLIGKCAARLLLDVRAG